MGEGSERRGTRSRVVGAVTVANLEIQDVRGKDAEEHIAGIKADPPNMAFARRSVTPDN